MICTRLTRYAYQLKLVSEADEVLSLLGQLSLQAEFYVLHLRFICLHLFPHLSQLVGLSREL